MKPDFNTELRLVVKPEYNGQSDEDVLAGASTAQEAKEIFQKWLDGRGLGETCHDVSAAQVYIGKNKTLVWLPNTLNRDQVIKHWRTEAAKRVKEIERLNGEVAYLRRYVAQHAEEWKLKLEATVKPLERKIKRLKRAAGRRK